ncbi:hypothetical protein Tco_0500384 [Tanacetum coccineum]
MQHVITPKGQKDLVFVKSSTDDTKVTIHGVEKPWLSEVEGFHLPNHDTADESSVRSTPLPLLEKLNGIEPISGQKTIKSILRSKSTFKPEALKGVIITAPSSAPANGNKSSSASKVHSAPAAFADEGNNNSDTDKIMARMDAITMKMDAQYKEIKSRNECNRCGGGYDILRHGDGALPENIDNEVRKVIQNGTPRREVTTGKDGLFQFSHYFSIEISGAEVSTEDANHKFLRSLPSACIEQEIPSSCTPSTSSTNIPEKEVLAGFADEVIYSLFAKQTEDLDLLHEDLEQIDDVDIEEMDINWQIAMIAIRMKKECTAKGTHDGKKKIDSLYQQALKKLGKQEKKSYGFSTMDDGIVRMGGEDIG